MGRLGFGAWGSFRYFFRFFFFKNFFFKGVS
jgi:hypothetical protein